MSTFLVLCGVLLFTFFFGVGDSSIVCGAALYFSTGSFCRWRRVHLLFSRGHYFVCVCAYWYAQATYWKPKRLSRKPYDKRLPSSDLLQAFGETHDALKIGYVLVGAEVIIAILFAIFVMVLSERLEVIFFSR